MVWVLTDLAFAEGLVGGGRHSSAGGGWLIKEGDEGGESWREMGASIWRGECSHTILAVNGWELQYGSCERMRVLRRYREVG